MASKPEEYSCSECNATVGENDKYCQNCGADLSETICEEQEQNAKVIINEKYISLNSKTTWLVALLSFSILVSIIGLFANISQLNLVQRVMDGFNVSEADATANDTRIQTIAIFQIFIFITTAIMYLFWKNRAYKNLKPLGSIDLEYSSGWAVGAYFVPILGLFRPFQIMREIWKASDPNSIANENNGDITWKSSHSHFLLPLWWTLFLTDSIFGQLSFRMSNKLDTLSQIYDYSIVSLISDLVGVPSAIILILLVKNISRRQEEKNDKITHLKSNNFYSSSYINNDTSNFSNLTELEKYEEIDDSSLNDIEKAKVFGETLGLKGKVSKADITRLYKEIIEKYHPDKVSHLGIEFQKYAEKKTKDINKAYSYFKKKYGL